MSEPRQKASSLNVCTTILNQKLDRTSTSLRSSTSLWLDVSSRLVMRQTSVSLDDFKLRIEHYYFPCVLIKISARPHALLIVCFLNLQLLPSGSSLRLAAETGNIDEVYRLIYLDGVDVNDQDDVSSFQRHFSFVKMISWCPEKPYSLVVQLSYFTSDIWTSEFAIIWLLSFRYLAWVTQGETVDK